MPPSECGSPGASAGPFATAREEIGGEDLSLSLHARIVSTSNQLDEEPWLPMKTIITLFRIQVRSGDDAWEVLRRYSDFSSLHAALAKVISDSDLPELPPKLLLNADENIAERHLELDAYLHALLRLDSAKRHGAVHEFLGATKQSVRYGVRNYEYDSSQSEGNRYIRDTDL